MKKPVIILLTILFLILQLYLAPAVKIMKFTPDFVLIFLCCLMADNGILTLIGVGLFMGLAIDITIAGSGLTNTVIYVAAAAGYGTAGYFIHKKGFLTSLVGAVSGGVLKYFILMFAMYIQRIAQQVSFISFLAGIPSILFTGMMTVPCYYGLKLLFNLDFMQNKPKDTRIFLGE